VKHNGFDDIIVGMKKNIIFVTGFIGSNRAGHARQMADENGMEFVDLDQEIEAKDGRSVRRIAMAMGEHEVRNKEYEALKDLLEREATAIRENESDWRGFVIACSDGIILDDECLALLAEGRVVLADEALTPEELWEQAKADPNPAYAFLSGDDEAEQYQRYLALYHARMPIYRRISI
jgi:shikimate kinase/3-dehydroquinate synthase